MLQDQVLDILTFDPNDPLRGGEKWYPLDLMTQSQVEYASGYRISDSKTSSANLTAVLTGELVEDFFGNGAIDFATLVDYNREIMDDNLLYPSGRLIGRGGAGGSGDRNRYAAAAEFSIPLMEDDVLRTNIALRYDHYDDATEVGGAFTPQVDLAFRPNEDILVRARYAETFRAPDLQRISSETVELFGSTGLTIPGQNDFYPRESDSYDSINSGSLALAEETGETWNIGLVYQITEDLSFNLDHWSVKLDGAVTSISTSYILDPSNFANYDFTGQVDDCTQLTGPGVVTQNISLEGTDGVTRDYLDLSCIRTGPINASLEDSKGVDLGFRYKFDTDYGRFSLATTATYLAERFTQDLPDARIIDEVAEEHNPEWKLNTRLNWSHGDYSATLSWFYVGSSTTFDENEYPRDPVTLIRLRDEDGKLLPRQDFWGKYGAWQKFNLTAQYRGIKDTKLSIGIFNLLDEDPELDPLYRTYSNDFTSSSGQDLYGRQFKLTAEYSF